MAGKKVAAGLAILVMSLSVGPIYGNTLINGSFEEGPEEVDGWLNLYEGDISITGWTVKSPHTEDAAEHDIDIVTTYWQQTDGLRSIDLSGLNGPGGLAQTFATLPGHVYGVSFMMAGNVGYSTPALNSYVMAMGVSAAGQSQDFTFDVLGHSYVDMGWEFRNWSFTANSSSTELWFYQVFPEHLTCGPALDNVHVTDLGAPVPEPSSLALLSGLGVMGLAGRRRRRTTV